MMNRQRSRDEMKQARSGMGLPKTITQGTDVASPLKRCVHRMAFVACFQSDFFGTDVSLSGERILIGAHRNDDCGSSSGSVYVFARTSLGWVEAGRGSSSSIRCGERSSGNSRLPTGRTSTPPAAARAGLPP